MLGFPFNSSSYSLADPKTERRTAGSTAPGRGSGAAWHLAPCERSDERSASAGDGVRASEARRMSPAEAQLGR